MDKEPREHSMAELIMMILYIPLAVLHSSAHVLSYYEPLNYDSSLLRSQHIRVTRDEVDHSHPQIVKLHLNAFNRLVVSHQTIGDIFCYVCRSFVSSLSHAKGVFGESVQFLVGGVKTEDYDRRSFYSGILEG